jgi:anti-repressor protein
MNQPINTALHSANERQYVNQESELKMNELIKVTGRVIGEAQVQTVNARELHAFLEVSTLFKDWIARRIADYEFEDGKDFCSFLSESTGGRPRKEYHITLAMAKEISMVERNANGKKARQYFIDCERQTKEISSRDPIQILGDPAAMRGLLLTYTEKVLALESTVSEQAPKVAALDRLAIANGAMCITNAAKTLQLQPKELFGWLQTNRWIYRRVGGSGWIAYQDKLQSQVLQHKITTIERSDGSEKVQEQVLVTAKGLIRLSEHFSTH